MAGLAFAPGSVADAADTSQAVDYDCTFMTFAVDWTTTVTLSGPDEVDPGDDVSIGISFADTAGPTNTAPPFVVLPAGTVTADVTVDGTTVTATGGTTPAAPANGTPIAISPLTATATAGDDDLVATLGNVTITLGSYGNMTCVPGAGSTPATLTVPVTVPEPEVPAGPTSYLCTFSGFSVPWSTTATLTGPDAIAPGASAAIGIAFADQAGPTNTAPPGVPLPAGSVTADVTVVGGTGTVSGGATPAAPANGTPIAISGLTGAVTATGAAGTDLEVTVGAITIALAPFGNMTCAPDAGTDLPSIVIPIEDDAPPTEPPPTTPPTTPTTPTPTEPTQPTDPGPVSPSATESVLVTKTASVSFTCSTSVGGAQLGSETASQTISITAPDKVNPGMTFPVSIKMSPGPQNGPVPIGAGLLTPTATISVTNGSPGTLRLTGSVNSAEIAPNAAVPVPTMSGRVTATGAVGSEITFTPGSFVFSAPSLGNATVTCTPSGDGAIASTAIVAEPVSLETITGSSSGLPVTGADGTATLVRVGLGALVAGGALVLAARKRRHTA